MGLRDVDSKIEYLAVKKFLVKLYVPHEVEERAPTQHSRNTSSPWEVFIKASWLIWPSHRGKQRMVGTNFFMVFFHPSFSWIYCRKYYRWCCYHGLSLESVEFTWKSYQRQLLFQDIIHSEDEEAGETLAGCTSKILVMEGERIKLRERQKQNHVVRGRT